MTVLKGLRIRKEFNPIHFPTKQLQFLHELLQVRGHYVILGVEKHIFPPLLIPKITSNYHFFRELRENIYLYFKC